MARRKRRVPTENFSPGKPLVLQVRGTLEWKSWLKELADFDRSDTSEIADRSIAAYARSIGFSKIPPMR